MGKTLSPNSVSPIGYKLTHAIFVELITKNQNMKKLLLVACVTLMITGCQKKSETEKAREVVNPAGIPSQPMSKELYDKWQKMHAIEPCTGELYDLSQRRHNLETQADFEKLAEEVDSTGQVKYYPGSNHTITLQDVLDVLVDKKIQCYDGWLEIKYDDGADTKISFSRSDTYDNHLSLYSEPLFKGILRRAGIDANEIQVHFAKIKIGVMRAGNHTERSKIGIRVTYRAVGDNQDTRLYYDMSDDPL